MYLILDRAHILFCFVFFPYLSFNTSILVENFDILLLTVNCLKFVAVAHIISTKVVMMAVNSIYLHHTVITNPDISSFQFFSYL